MYSYDSSSKLVGTQEVLPDELHLHVNVRHQLAAQDQATIP